MEEVTSSKRESEIVHIVSPETSRDITMLKNSKCSVKLSKYTNVEII